MKRALAEIHRQLDALYSPEELRELIRWMMEEVAGIPPYRLLLADDILTQEQQSQISAMVARLAKKEPLQYILGKTEFCGLPFQVNRDVLIPRPETEQLVRLIADDFHLCPSVQILDIGTGSGCIAVSLASLLPKAQVTGLDVSSSALRVAAGNAQMNQVSVSWICEDILQSEADACLDLYDCIVSNPPYIMDHERMSMDAGVLDYEPHLALFVPDTDPFIFYRRIVQLAKQHLTFGGWLYFEINEQCGDAMVSLLSKADFTLIEIIKDYFGKDRILKAQWNYEKFG